MDTPQLIDLAEILANDLLEIARVQNLTPHDLLMAITIAERLLQSSLFPGDKPAVLRALQEADATFTAVSHNLEAN